MTSTTMLLVVSTSWTLCLDESEDTSGELITLAGFMVRGDNMAKIVAQWRDLKENKFKIPPDTELKYNMPGDAVTRKLQAAGWGTRKRHPFEPAPLAPMLAASQARYSDLLQIADVIAGCVQFCTYNLRGANRWDATLPERGLRGQGPKADPVPVSWDWQEGPLRIRPLPFGCLSRLRKAL